MIVESRTIAQASLQVVATRVRRLLVDQQLGGLATSATRDGEALLMRAGAAGISKQIAVQALEPTPGPGRIVIPMRWVATGVAGDLFPALDGNLELRELGAASTELSLVGSYRPPLGRTGEVLDQLLLRRFARRTLESFLGRLAEAVGDAAAEPAQLRRLDPQTDY